MKFLINKSVLGTENNFIISDDEFIVQNHNKDNIWTVDKNEESIKSITLI